MMQPVTLNQIDARPGKKNPLFAALAMCLLAMTLMATAKEVAAETAPREVITGYMRLGDIYMNASASQQDKEKAFHYYKLAEEAGSITARLQIGQMLIHGEGLKKDVNQGLKLVKQAADEGRVPAYVFLGQFYSAPDNDRQDLGRAMEYFDLAAAAGDENTLLLLAAMYRDGDKVAPDPVKAFQYYSRAKKAGSATATIETATMLILGEGTERDVATGERLLTEMAQSGKISALVAQGDLKLRGATGQFDPKGAIKSYEKAAKLGSVQAMLRLGDLYFYNNFQMRNPRLALQYYKQAADLEDSYGIYSLGKALTDDPKTTVAGLELLAKAKNAGNESAIVAIANTYFFGLGIRADIKKGLAILNEANAEGNIDAAKRLLRIYRDGLADGRRKLIRPSLKQAQLIFDQLKPKLGIAEVAYESILLEAALTRTGKADQFFPKIMALPARDRQKLVRELRSVNENDYVEVLQLRMKTLGLFSGKDSGLLDGGTIRAINDFCQKKSATPQCRSGPVSYQAAEILSAMY